MQNGKTQTDAANLQRVEEVVNRAFSIEKHLFEKGYLSVAKIRSPKAEIETIGCTIASDITYNYKQSDNIQKGKRSLEIFG